MFRERKRRTKTKVREKKTKLFSFPVPITLLLFTCVCVCIYSPMCVVRGIAYYVSVLFFRFDLYILQRYKDIYSSLTLTCAQEFVLVTFHSYSALKIG